MKVGVKFCGNCNPQRDMPELLNLLSIVTEKIRFVRWQEPPFEILLILSGCPVDCATRPEFFGPCIVVTNESVDRCLVPADELPARILEAMLRHLPKNN